MKKGIAVISRLRKNAVGWDDPPEYSGRGRPRKRGKKWKLADLLKEFEPESLSVHIYGKDCQVAAVVRDVWLRNIPKKVRVVVIEGIKKPAILVCTDIGLSSNRFFLIPLRPRIFKKSRTNLNQYSGSLHSYYYLM